MEFDDSSADASQTSASDNMLDVRGLPQLCAEKYWKVVEREELCCKSMDKFYRRIVQIRIVQIIVTYFLRARRMIGRDRRVIVLPLQFVVYTLENGW